ncbi:MAG: glycosyltransferase family 2 protein [Acidobacteriota bacterium]
MSGLLLVLAVIALVLAANPFGLALFNLLLYRPPRAVADRPTDDEAPRVSILIPARDEEAVIEAAVGSALASRGTAVEVLVMDDHSSDRTAEIVQRMASADARVRLLEAPPLPPGWAGKQHACQALADHARAPILLFVDADVELSPQAAARIAGFMEERRLDLASGFPRQRTESFAERLIIPLIHFVLLGYLPLLGMRLSGNPGFAAGCGQLMAARRDAYRRAGGHGAIRASFHDGIQLPRTFRRAGLRTDLFDATHLATCRMYSRAGEVVMGLAKNAHEGMAGPIAIWVWTILLLGGAVLPWALLAITAVVAPATASFAAALTAALLGPAARLLLALRFRQSWLGAVLHPLGVSALVAIQWFAWWRRRTGRRIGWKKRAAV